MDFQYLYLGMSGNKLVDYVNGDLRNILTQFTQVSNELNIRVLSNNIKEIKVEDNIVYYTTEEKPTGSIEDTRTWVSLQAKWGNIAGNILDQSDLKTALDNKVGTTTFNQLSSDVGTLSDNVVLISGSLATVTDRVSTLEDQINNVTDGILLRLEVVETELETKIGSPTIIEIRVGTDGNLEYTTNGVVWNPVADTGFVEWGNIVGDINNQADLKSFLDDIQGLIDELNEELTTINNHLLDRENPHAVSKEQVGLGNVDNTSDMDKPVSTAQQAAIDRASSGGSFRSLTSSEFNALETKVDTTIYFINNKDN